MSNFDFAALFERIALLDTIEQDLAAAGIKISATQPDFTQDCTLPLIFPSRQPSISMAGVKKFSVGFKPNQMLGTYTYDLNFIYLHIKKKQAQGVQQFRALEYQAPIMNNVALFIKAMLRQHAWLGVASILPGAMAIDQDLDGPKGGGYLGATITLNVVDIYQGFNPDAALSGSNDLNYRIIDNGGLRITGAGDNRIV